MSQTRNARPPASGSSSQSDGPAVANDVAIKTVDQVQLGSIKSATAVKNSLYVALKSDEEGVTAAQRQVHINKISQLCRQYNMDDTGYPFAGIEVRFDEVSPGYLGHFHPKVEAAIREDKVSIWRRATYKLENP